MSVLDRATLEASSLADLHAIASELSLDDYRRLRKGDLVDALVGHQEGSAPADAEEPSGETEEPAGSEESTAAGRRRRGRRGGRGRGGAASDADAGGEGAATAQDGEEGDREQVEATGAPGAEPEIIEGVVELLAGGSGFVRVSPPDPSDGDVYVSAAQVKRCELVSGDRITGPSRAPHRSERFPSLIRIDTVNGRPASEIGDRARFDDLAAELPSERFKLGSEHATLKAIDTTAPFGRGSRVTIVGPTWSGKSQTLRALAEALAGQSGVSVLVALAGVRPEEISSWGDSSIAPTAAVSFAGSPEAQDHAVELVVDQAKRLVTRGEHAVVLIDTLDGLQPLTARRVSAAARKVAGGGSLTVIATASEPLGGESTIIALESEPARLGKAPALDILASGTLRPELLVGKTAANAIARQRVKALG